MYIIAVLCMIKIYQTRHPDINARAPITFGVLALIILIGLVGVLNGSNYFWIIFTIMHLLICLYLTVQIYYMGRWRFRGFFSRIIQVIFPHLIRLLEIYCQCYFQPLYSHLLFRPADTMLALALDIYSDRYTCNDS